MLQQCLYIPFKWALFISFADVMSFFISVYLLIRVSEKCQNILFLLLKRREIQDFHRFGIPSYFSFPKLLFIEYHTIISEICFYNREFHYLFFWGVILGVAFTVILGVILNFLSTFLRFLSSFSVYFIELLSTFSVYIFAIMTTIFIIQRIIFIVLGFTLSLGVHIIVHVTINSVLEFWFFLHFLPNGVCKHYQSYEQLLPELQKQMQG